MGKAKYPGPPAALEAYAAAVEASSIPALKGAKNPHTSRNGHMFSFLGPEGGAAIRLPDDLRRQFMAQYDSGPVEQYGRTMQGYAAVPETLLEDTVEFVVWLDRSHEWIGTLDPKPTNK